MRLRLLRERLAAAVMAAGGRRAHVVGAVLAILCIAAVGVAGSTLMLRAGATTPGTASPAATTSSSVAPSPSPFKVGGGGPQNVVQVINQSDNKFRVNARLQYNELEAQHITPGNYALAYSSCVNCQTLAVALQLNLYPRSVTDVAPANVATAVNYHCTGCTTIGYALQYDIPVDDPHNPPDRVRQLVTQMRVTLATVNAASTSPADAESRISAVIAQFQDLAASLITQRQQATDPTSPNATPAPTASPGAATPSPGGSPSATPTSSSSPSPSPSPSPS
ncbi:MAG TPA: hypothetical protein VF134_01430 [Candidatus Dormibacteraeota bacterium]